MCNVGEAHLARGRLGRATALQSARWLASVGGGEVGAAARGRSRRVERREQRTPDSRSGHRGPTRRRSRLTA